MTPNLRCAAPALPKAWSGTVRSAVLHTIALARFVMTHGWAATEENASHIGASATELDRLKTELERVRAERDRMHQMLGLLQEVIRILIARMLRIPAHQRPHYLPTERMEILEVRAALGWSTDQTAEMFVVSPATLRSWNHRLDERGPDALVQLPEPVNRFPDFVRHIVQRLKVLCPILGKVKIAEILSRARFHLSASSVGRILKEEPAPEALARAKPAKGIVAKHPNHVWHVDLTAVPITGGFWTTWRPFALPQCWPFCWWVAVLLDQTSRRIMGFAVFHKPPTSEAMRAFLARAIHRAQATPKYLVCDKGSQFWCPGFKLWLLRRNIRPRYGAVGCHGSLAFVERLILTLKTEGLAGLLVPFRYAAFRHELTLFANWYNEHRPHMGINGNTPNEVYYYRKPANRMPRLEPRPRWPRGSPCSKPRARLRGEPGAEFSLSVSFVAGRKSLPVVELIQAPKLKPAA